MSNALLSLSGKLNSMNGALASLGIDVGALQQTAASFQLIGGSAETIKGLIAAKEAVIAFKSAQATANLAKYHVGAPVVAALAAGAGAAMGVMIEKAINTDDSGTGMRRLAGGYTNGRY